MMTCSLLAVMIAATLATGQNPAPAAGSDDSGTPRRPPAAEAPAVDPDSIGISLEKIQKAVTRPPPSS